MLFGNGGIIEPPHEQKSRVYLHSCAISSKIDHIYAGNKKLCDKSTLALIWGLFDIFHWCYEGRKNNEDTLDIDVDRNFLNFGGKFSNKINNGYQFIKTLKEEIEMSKEVASNQDSTHEKKIKSE